MSTNIPESVKLLTNNARNQLRTDYEMINAALDIELNVAMGALSVRRVIESRLITMTKRERAIIPLIIWEFIDALDVTGSGFGVHNPQSPAAGEETRSEWFTLTVEDETATIKPRKVAPARFINALKAKERFVAWQSCHGVIMKRGTDVVTLRAKIIAGLDAVFMKRVLDSM